MAGQAPGETSRLGHAFCSFLRANQHNNLDTYLKCMYAGD
jgi:hypothetical protein